MPIIHLIPYKEAVGKRLNNSARLITTQPVTDRARIETQVLTTSNQAKAIVSLTK